MSLIQLHISCLSRVSRTVIADRGIANPINRLALLQVTICILVFLLRGRMTSSDVSTEFQFQEIYQIFGSMKV